MEGVTEVPFKFEYDSTSGKYGYRDGADTFRPFNDGGGSDPVLLWTNPSPTSAYSGGIIPVDSYPYYIVEVRYNTTVNNIHTYILDINKSASGAFYIAAMRSGYASYTRGLYFNTSNVQFASSAYQIGSSSGASSNQCCIPTRVWGCESAIPSGATSITIPRYIASIGKSSSGVVGTANSYTSLTFNNMNSYTNISIESVSSDSSCVLQIFGDGQTLYNNSGQTISNISVNFSNISSIQIYAYCPSLTVQTVWSMTIATLTNIIIS